MQRLGSSLSAALAAALVASPPVAAAADPGCIPLRDGGGFVCPAEAPTEGPGLAEGLRPLPPGGATLGSPECDLNGEDCRREQEQVRHASGIAHLEPPGVRRAALEQRVACPLGQDAPQC